MVGTLHRTSCCGLREYEGLDDLNTAEEALLDMHEAWDDMEGAFIIFTDPTCEPGGERLCKYITRYRLGKVTKIRAKINPNSNNMLRVYIWAVNITKYDRWIDNAGMPWVKKNRDIINEEIETEFN